MTTYTVRLLNTNLEIVEYVLNAATPSRAKYQALKRYTDMELSAPIRKITVIRTMDNKVVYTDEV